VEATQEKQKEWKEMTDAEIRNECSRICDRFSDEWGDKKEMERKAKDAILERFGRSAAVSFSNARCPVNGRMVMGTIWSPRGKAINF
jgi:hypothetical protein